MHFEGNYFCMRITGRQLVAPAFLFCKLLAVELEPHGLAKFSAEHLASLTTSELFAARLITLRR